MKTSLLIALLALVSLVGSTGAWSQTPPREFVVLSSLDTIIGRTALKYAHQEKKNFLRVISGESEREFGMEEVAAFRLSGTDYIVKPNLHPENPVRHYTVIARGRVALFGQLCPSCSYFHNVHAELEDGNIICMNKENYYSKLLPHLTKSREFKEAVKNKSVRYPFFQNLAIKRVTSLVNLYNGVPAK